MNTHQTKITIRQNKLGTGTEQKLKSYSEGYQVAKQQCKSSNGISREHMLYIACHSTLASEAFYDGMIAYLVPRAALFIVPTD